MRKWKPVETNKTKTGNVRGEWQKVVACTTSIYLIWCTEEWVLTLHGFAEALSQLPAMFLKQPVPDVILAERTEEKKTKNIPIIRGAFPRRPSQNTHKKIKTKAFRSHYHHQHNHHHHHHHHYCHSHHLQRVTSVSSSTRSGKGGWREWE